MSLDTYLGVKPNHFMWAINKGQNRQVTGDVVGKRKYVLKMYSPPSNNSILEEIYKDLLKGTSGIKLVSLQDARN